MLKKTPSLISVLGPARSSLAGDMMVDGVNFPPLMKVAVLLYSRPLVLSGLATQRALS